MRFKKGLNIYRCQFDIKASILLYMDGYTNKISISIGFLTNQIIYKNI